MARKGIRYVVIASEGYTDTRYEISDGEFAVVFATALREFHIDTVESCTGKTRDFEVRIAVEKDNLDDKKCNCKCND